MADVDRPINEGIGALFTGTTDATTGILTSMGYNQKDLEDAGLLQRFFIDKMCWDARNRNGFAAFMLYASKSNEAVPSTQIKWNAADEEKVLLGTLGADFITNAVTITLDTTETQLMAGNHVMVSCYDTGATPPIAGQYNALVKIIAGANTDSDPKTNVYDCALVSLDGAGTSPYTFDITGGTSENIQVFSVTSTVPIDGTASAGVFKTPIMVANNMERVRESVNIGTHSNADALVFDGSIQNQARVKWYAFLEKLQNKLIYSSHGAGARTATTNTGQMNGLLHFLKPHKVAASSYLVDAEGNTTTLRAYNRVFPSSGITRSDFEEYLIGPMGMGKENVKQVFCPPHMAMKLFYALMPTGANAVTSDFVIPGTTKVWQGFEVQLGTGKIQIVPIYSMQGYRMTVHDNCHDDSKLATQVLDWGIVYDSSLAEVVYHDVADDGGVQSPRLKEVSLNMNDSRRMKEWDTELTLMVKRPDGFGVFAIDEA